MACKCKDCKCEKENDFTTLSYNSRLGLYKTKCCNAYLETDSSIVCPKCKRQIIKEPY